MQSKVGRNSFFDHGSHDQARSDFPIKKQELQPIHRRRNIRMQFKELWVPFIIRLADIVTLSVTSQPLIEPLVTSPATQNLPVPVHGSHLDQVVVLCAELTQVADCPSVEQCGRWLRQQGFRWDHSWFFSIAHSKHSQRKVLRLHVDGSIQRKNNTKNTRELWFEPGTLLSEKTRVSPT